MLARAGEIPSGDGFAFEVKWDGFRGLVLTGDKFTVRSRRGWDMTELAPELAELPPGLLLDGELVCFDGDRRPSFEAAQKRLLGRDRRVSLAYAIFDVLAVDGKSLMTRTYRERRARLEELELNANAWFTVPVFDDGPALFKATLEQGLEGVVCKRLEGTYRPGRRDWIKVKHKHTVRFQQELSLARSSRRR
jgi:bifunctional non-homologous end joining protein LigD